MTPTYVPVDGVLHSPERNRFFYGKLMDVAQFEQEQGYFRRQQWLINRLALGSGVLAGLNLTAGSGGPGTVRIEPGAAIDGAGRLIVVPHPVEADAHQLTDDLGVPAGSPVTTGLVLLSLAYAEAAINPVPVLTPHCDAPGACSPATVLESFLVLARLENAVPPVQFGCTLGNFPPPPDPSLLKLLSGNVSGSFPAVPADTSVPLGHVNLADGWIDAFAERPLVFSNPVLWQVIVCLAQQAGAIHGAILRYAGGDNQGGTTGKPLASPLVVELVDGGGNAVGGTTVQFQPASGSGTASPATIATDQQGRAQTTWTLGSTVGDQSLIVGAVGSPLSVKFSAKAKKG